MAQIGLPFAPLKLDKKYSHDGPSSLRDTFPPRLRSACKEHALLDEYMHCLPLEKIGLPTYYPKATRELAGLEDHNLIYPIKEGLFVHIWPTLGDRDYYIPVEPNLTVDVSKLAGRVEAELLDYAERIGQAETAEGIREALLEVIDEICTIWQADGYVRRGSGKIRVTLRELEGIKYHLVREKTGLGVLQPLLEDPFIEDISCSGVGAIFIEHKIFKSLQSSVAFDTLDELDEFVVWLGEWIKKPVTVRKPIVDAVLPDGSRINIVYGRDIATRGSNFTIRKFSETPISVLELVEFGTLDYTMAAYLSLVLEEGMNMFVAGATASGKTTTLNALTTFIPADAKIITIEDTPEVQVPHKNWLREVTRGSGETKDGEVSMFALLKAALRQRPDLIIIGEIRGEEGAIAFQAMQTGHAVLSTFHAASVERLIQRLTGAPISIPKTYMENLNLALIQAVAKGPDGKRVRRIRSISEIIGYDPTSESFSFIEVFRWNQAKDTFDFPGNMNSYLLEEVIAMKRGIPPHKKKTIYSELKKRARIFQRILEDRNTRDYHEFFQILSEAHSQGLL